MISPKTHTHQTHIYNPKHTLSPRSFVYEVYVSLRIPTLHSHYNSSNLRESSATRHQHLSGPLSWLIGYFHSLSSPILLVKHQCHHASPILTSRQLFPVASRWNQIPSSLPGWDLPAMCHLSLLSDLHAPPTFCILCSSSLTLCLPHFCLDMPKQLRSAHEFL